MKPRIAVAIGLLSFVSLCLATVGAVAAVTSTPLVMLTKEMPTKPVEGQFRGPCEYPSELKRGACWNPVIDPRTGKQMTGCKQSKQFFADEQDKCWFPAYEKPAEPHPRAVDPQSPEAP